MKTCDVRYGAVTDQNTPNLDTFYFVLQMYSHHENMCQGGVGDHVFSQTCLVTPLASAKGWHQRQTQHFALARQTFIFEKNP